MHPNGTPTATEPPVTPTDPAAGDIFIPMDDLWRAFLADLRWIDEQYSLGTFDEYRGEYIAVVDKKVLGHGKRLQEMKDEVARTAGVPRGRVATTLIIRKPIDW